MCVKTILFFVLIIQPSTIAFKPYTPTTFSLSCDIFFYLLVILVMNSIPSKKDSHMFNLHQAAHQYIPTCMYSTSLIKGFPTFRVVYNYRGVHVAS